MKFSKTSKICDLSFQLAVIIGRSGQLNREQASSTITVFSYDIYQRFNVFLSLTWLDDESQRLTVKWLCSMTM